MSPNKVTFDVTNLKEWAAAIAAFQAEGLAFSAGLRGGQLWIEITGH